MSFTSSIEEITNTRRKFKILVPSTSVKDVFSKIANEIQSSAEIKGFRKGKAPLSIVRKFYINDIAKKAVDRVINDAYGDVIKNVDFQIVSYPHIEPENQFDESSDFQFSATVDINPVIEIKNYKNLTINLPEFLNINIDNEIEKMLKVYAKSLGGLEDVNDRSAEENDSINIDYKIMLNDQKYKSFTNQTLELANTLPEFKNAVIGLNPNETKIFSVSFPENYHDEQLSGKTAQFDLVLNKIQKHIPIAIDDELAKKINTKDLTEAKESIKSSIEKSNNDLRTKAAMEQVVTQILAENSFEVAESLVDEAINRMIQEENRTLPKNQQKNEKDDSVRAIYHEPAIKQVRSVLALGHIARQEHISVSDHEVYENVLTFAKSNNIDPRQFLKQNDRHIIDEFRGQVMLQKVVAYVLNNANLTYTNTP